VSVDMKFHVELEIFVSKSSNLGAFQIALQPISVHL
jgi:hypothetical protein